MSLSVPFTLFLPPYRELIPLDAPADLFRDRDLMKGVALIWRLDRARGRQERQIAMERTPGVALVMILPPAETIPQDVDLLTTLEECRPHSVLPHHPSPDPEELAGLLGRIPADLPMQFTDFLQWRGVSVDRETRRIIRRTVEVSGELRTVSALSRSVYLSRRALGRRFLSRGLPVPSHWLQFARVLRAAIQLQSSSDSLFTVACDLGYPDGFALSNQMKRLVGVRPSMARECLGWEWLVESWLRKEEAEGGLALPTTEGSPPVGGRRISDTYTPPSMGPGSRPRSARLRSTRRR